MTFRLLLLVPALLLCPLARAQTVIAVEHAALAASKCDVSGPGQAKQTAGELAAMKGNASDLVAAKRNDSSDASRRALRSFTEAGPSTTIALTSHALDKSPLTDARTLPAMSHGEGSASVTFASALTQAAESVLDSDHTLAFTDFALTPLPTMRNNE